MAFKRVLVLIQEIIKDLKNSNDMEKRCFLDIKQEYLQNKLNITMQKDYNEYFAPTKPNNNQYVSIAKPKKSL